MATGDFLRAKRQGSATSRLEYRRGPAAQNRSQYLEAQTSRIRLAATQRWGVAICSMQSQKIQLQLGDAEPRHLPQHHRSHPLKACIARRRVLLGSEAVDATLDSLLQHGVGEMVCCDTWAKLVGGAVAREDPHFLDKATNETSE